MRYKGYKGTVRYSFKDKVFHGKLKDITDFILYEGKTYKELKKYFKEAVDEYIIIQEKGCKKCIYNGESECILCMQNGGKAVTEQEFKEQLKENLNI